MIVTDDYQWRSVPLDDAAWVQPVTTDDDAPHPAVLVLALLSLACWLPVLLVVWLWRRR